MTRVAACFRPCPALVPHACPPHRWTDAWLAALALSTGLRLVSLDADFHAFPGLSWLHLTTASV